MPKSKKRGGEKAHRKRVAIRTASVKAKEKRERQLFESAMMEQIEQMRQSMSAKTENNETSNESAESIQETTNIQL